MWFPRLSVFEKEDLAKPTELAASGVYSLYLSVQHVLVYELKIKGNLTCILLYLYIWERKGGRECVCSTGSPGSNSRLGIGRLKMERLEVSSWLLHQWPPASHRTGLCLCFTSHRMSVMTPTWTSDVSLCHTLWVSGYWWHHHSTGHCTQTQGVNHLSVGNQHAGPSLTLKCNQFWMVHSQILIPNASSHQA